jgi:hypothetical protein
MRCPRRRVLRIAEPLLFQVDQHHQSEGVRQRTTNVRDLPAAVRRGDADGSVVHRHAATEGPAPSARGGDLAVVVTAWSGLVHKFSILPSGVRGRFATSDLFEVVS